MEVVWINQSIATKVFEPFVTTHLDPEGREIRVGSQTQLSKLCNQFGLNRVDDPGLEMRDGKLSKIPKKVTYFT